MSNTLVVVDGKPMRAKHLVWTSGQMNTHRCILETVSGIWMMFKENPAWCRRPSGRLVYVFNRPDDTLQVRLYP